jgi:hypothetical protein
VIAVAQDGAQMLAYWSSRLLPQTDVNQAGTACEGLCTKCAMRKYSQTFQAQIATTGKFLYFSKQLAEEQTRGKSALLIPHPLLNLLAFRNTFVEQHVAHVTSIHTPGIIVFSGRRVILIDGTHRAIAALRSGREYMAYCLGARETAYCLMETETWMAKEKAIAHDAVEFASRVN